MRRNARPLGPRLRAARKLPSEKSAGIFFRTARARAMINCLMRPSRQFVSVRHGDSARSSAFLPHCKIDRRPIVRIDQAQIPIFGALINIGHARCRKFDQRLGETIRRAGRRDRRAKSAISANNSRRSRQKAARESVGRALHRLVRRRPVAVQFGFAQSFLLPCSDALGIRGQPR